MSINEKFVKAIEATGNPTASMILQEAYAATAAVGKLFKPIVSSKEAIQAISDRLLKDFPDAELDKLCETPEFSMALALLLNQSILAYARRL